MRSTLLLVALALTPPLAACRSFDVAAVDAPAPEAADVPGASAALGVATSPCGRYRLRLDHAEWAGGEHERPLLTLQMTCETFDDDAFVCGGVRVTDLVSAAGVEWREKGLGGTAGADSRWGGVIVRGLEQDQRADSVRRVRVECHVMRVLEWRTFEVACDGPDAAAEFVCPPYHVGVSGDAATVSVSAFATDDWKSFPAPQRDLFGLLGHDWVASGVALIDATGEPLQGWGGGGSGGVTVAMYGSAMVLGQEPAPIRYPVTGTSRLPARYVVEVVPFEFVDLPLIRE